MEKLYIPGTNIDIFQNKNQYGFSVDSILLSAFCATTKRNGFMIDICSGGGIVAFRNLFLYKTKTMIGIEIQKNVSHIFEESIKLNRLEDKISVINGAFQEYKLIYKDKVDSISCNPPYIKKGEGIVNPDENFAISRHEISMEIEDVFDFAKTALKDKGKLFLVHKPHRLNELCVLGNKYNMNLKRLKAVSSKANTAPKIILLEFVKNSGEFLNFEKPVILYNEDGTYTDEVLKVYEGASL